MAKGKVTHRIAIERLGTLQEWVMRDDAFKGHPNLRRAYEAGFRARTQDFNQGIENELKATVPAQTVGDAYAVGYTDARKQESPA